MNIEQARSNMIEQQIRPWNVLRFEVLATLAKVKREAFVPDAWKALAFCDMHIPLKGQAIENEDGCGPVMLAPKLEAKILHDLALQGGEMVLEIGTGSGYSAALLAQHAAQVVSYEIDAQLAVQARRNLNRQGVCNVQVQHADGSKALPPKTFFDVIVLSGSVAQIPSHLLAHLKPQGRLLAVVGDAPTMSATLVDADGRGQWRSRSLWDTDIARLQGFEDTPLFVF